MRAAVFALLSIFVLSNTTFANEWSGYIAAEARLFPNDPAFPDQKNQSASLAAQPEYYYEWEEGRSLTFVPFLRLDTADSERTHFDLRELFGLWVFDGGELGVGVRKVFWGVTESQHLVDIINQTDLVEFPDGEDKLGQPMINLSIPRDWGTLDFFVMPYFQERTFPGQKGRLRTALVVNTDQARFESDAEEYHIDAAIRYTHTIGDWEGGLSYFRGTGREPTFILETDGSGSPVLAPFYEQIAQTGLDLSWVVEAWLFKLETIHRTGQGDGFVAATGGFEYTMTNIAGSRMDLGMISEWLYDTRGDSATTPFENDVMAGFRLAVNDIASTEFLIGLIQDLDSPARVMSLETHRRVGDHFKLEVEGFVFSRQDKKDLLYSLRDDDFIQMTLAYYF